MTFRVHALLLAAGRSSRTGASHKLLSTFDGVPLVRRSAATALAAKAAGVTVIVGYRASEIRSALNGLPVRIVENPRWAEGLSTSLIAGFGAAPNGCDGVLVMLADQPFLEPRHLDQLIDAFSPTENGSIVAATHDGTRFNPVVISLLYELEITILSGDIGARKLLARHADLVREVDIGRAASFDADTLDAIREAGGVPEAVPQSS